MIYEKADSRTVADNDISDRVVLHRFLVEEVQAERAARSFCGKLGPLSKSESPSLGGGTQLSVMCPDCELIDSLSDQ